LLRKAPTPFSAQNTSSRIGGYASAWDRFYSGKWERFSCDIGMASEYAALPKDVKRSELAEPRRGLLESFVYTLVHEVGHCIGLLHAGALPSTYRWTEERRRDVFLHPLDPAMSYGWNLTSPDALSADDIAGASLLRPTARFQWTTGTISGTLELEGEPAPYATCSHITSSSLNVLLWKQTPGVRQKVPVPSRPCSRAESFEP